MPLLFPECKKNNKTKVSSPIVLDFPLLQLQLFSKMNICLFENLIF